MFSRQGLQDSSQLKTHLPMRSVPIGIHVGTVNSYVSVLTGNVIKLIPNASKHRVTPSCVAYTDNGWVIGLEALRHPKVQNVLYGLRRSIGWKFDDYRIQSELKNWPFTVKPNAEGETTLQVTKRWDTLQFHPVEVLSIILRSLKADAERYLATSVTTAAITVPTHFCDVQRRATLEAARVAGFEESRLVNQTTAAALAYAFEEKPEVLGKQVKKALIFNLGGGTCGVSIVDVSENGLFRIIATSGDSRLGGLDFTNRLVNHCVDAISREYEIDIRRYPDHFVRLQEECEIAKCELSTATETYVVLDVDGLDVDIRISRIDFNYLCDPLFNRCRLFVEEVLSEARVHRDDIHKIVPVGGAVRMPRIRDILLNIFGQRDLRAVVEPNLAVAYGAALRAANRGRKDARSTAPIFVNDVTSMAFGVPKFNEDFESRHVFCRILKRSTPLSVVTYKHFPNILPNTTLDIYEGNGNLLRLNTLVARLVLEDLPTSSTGERAVSIALQTDKNGVLMVRAYSGEPPTPIPVKLQRIGIAREAVDRMVTAARNNAGSEADVSASANHKPNVAQAALKRRCESYCTWAMERIRSERNPSEPLKEALYGKVEELLRCCQDYPNIPEQTFIKLQKELEMLLEPDSIEDSEIITTTACEEPGPVSEDGVFAVKRKYNFNLQRQTSVVLAPSTVDGAHHPEHPPSPRTKGSDVTDLKFNPFITAAGLDQPTGWTPLTIVTRSCALPRIQERLAVRRFGEGQRRQER